MTKWKTSACRGCGAPMIWTLTKKEKKLPLDPEETSRAEVGPKALLFEIHPPAEEDRDRTSTAVLTHAESGHLAHWVTCEKRDQFKGGSR